VTPDGDARRLHLGTDVHPQLSRLQSRCSAGRLLSKVHPGTRYCIPTESSRAPSPSRWYSSWAAAMRFALPYLVLGVSTYSSAGYNFVPQFAQDFYAAVRAGDTASVFKALKEFVIPFCNCATARRATRSASSRPA
jgi:hypothetical protein